MEFVVAVLLEAMLILAPAASVAAALLGDRQACGWQRVGWCLVACAFGWVLFGELVLLVTGLPVFIVRWTRGTPARVLLAVGLWMIVWHPWRRGQRASRRRGRQ